MAVRNSKTRHCDVKPSDRRITRETGWSSSRSLTKNGIVKKT
jgi:hypothetical protein